MRGVQNNTSNYDFRDFLSRIDSAKNKMYQIQAFVDDKVITKKICDFKNISVAFFDTKGNPIINFPGNYKPLWSLVSPNQRPNCKW